MNTAYIYAEQIEPVFVRLTDYNLAMLNKADIDGGGTTGGTWYQDTILSDLFPNYKQVIRVLGGQMAIEYGNVELTTHRFLVTDENGLKVKVGGTEGTIWNTLNLTNVSQLNNDAGYLQANDLDGFIYNVVYNSATHTITFYQQNEPNIVIDLPIEQLIKGVQLVGNDLVFTFEDGSAVTVPLNTLLVGVVKSVNGLTPNSQGEIVLNITDIPNLSSELANKLDIRMAGLVSNLTQPEKDAILSKLGVVNNIVQVLGLSGNTITLSNGGGSISLNIANIGGLQTALDGKASVNGNNIPSGTYWGNLTSDNSINWNGLTVDWATNNTNPIDVLGWDNTAQVNRPINRNGLLTWLNLQNDYAYRDSSNILNPTLWRNNLGVYSKSEANSLFVKQGGTPNHQGNNLYLGWSGSQIELQVDLTHLGYLWHSGNFDPNSKANTSGYYSGLSVGSSDNATKWNNQTYLELGTNGSVSHFMTFDPDNNLWRKADTNYIQNILGITIAYWNSKLGAGSNISLLTNDAGYIISSALGNYVNKAGDTMSGALLIGVNILGQQRVLHLAEPTYTDSYGFDFTTDTNTGFLNIYGLNNGVRNSIPNLSIDRGSGNVGIGENANTTHRLSVNGSGSFSGNVIIPNATAPNHAVNKSQLDAVSVSIPNAPNNGTFTVQGTGALTGGGSTSADASANTSVNLDLTTATKNDITAGKNASTQVTSLFADAMEYFKYNDVSGGGSVDANEAFFNLVNPTTVSGLTIDIGDHYIKGARLVLQGVTGIGGIVTYKGRFIMRNHVNLGTLTVEGQIDQEFVWDANVNRWREVF